MSEALSYMLYQSAGICLIDEGGKCYIDGSSGAMVADTGHANPRVLAKIKARMDRATVGYRQHFRAHPSEGLAAKASEASENARFQYHFRGHFPMLKASCSAFLCGRGGRHPGNSEGLLQ